MDDEMQITSDVAVSLFAAHIAAAIRAAASDVREQRTASERYERGRVISERITKGEVEQPPLRKGDDRRESQALQDVQAFADALRHLPWLCDHNSHERSEAVTHHRRVVSVLDNRLAERAARYRFDAAYLLRCLDQVEGKATPPGTQGES